MNRDDTDENKTEWLRAATEAHQPALLRYVTRLLGDHDRARDVVQEAFIKLMGQSREAVSGHLAEWLFTVCRHGALDVLRKEGRMKSLDTSGAAEIPSPDLRPGRALEKAETQATLLALIGRLPETHQEVVRLKFQNGFSYKEISRITDKSVSHVGVLLHEAMCRLRAEFAASGN